MEELFAKSLAQELKIDLSQLIQEEWEMQVLNLLFSSPLGKNLIFKGGTALRLAYGSPRFSEDLDFSLLENIEYKRFQELISQIVKSFPEMKIDDIYSKFYTLYAKLQIKDILLAHRFPIKVEISRREKEEDWGIRTLTSPTTNIQAVCKVQTLEQITKDKLLAIKTRSKPRDFFDLWYIYNLSRSPQKLPKVKISKMKFKAELRKFLPRTYWEAIEQIAKEVSS